MTIASLSDVLKFIHFASKEDRARISQTLSYCHAEDIAKARAELKVGDRVKFTAKRRGYPFEVRGVITQKNTKTVHVRPHNGGTTWRVTPTMVQRDDEGEG